jgi:hypothetical protein
MSGKPMRPGDEGVELVNSDWVQQTDEFNGLGKSRYFVSIHGASPFGNNDFRYFPLHFTALLPSPLHQESAHKCIKSVGKFISHIPSVQNSPVYFS